MVEKIVWLTKAQRRAVYNIYQRNADGASSYREFRRRVFPGISWEKNKPGTYVMVNWCRMFLGIEHDGYTHS
jgi:hypothetical protein